MARLRGMVSRTAFLGLWLIRAGAAHAQQPLEDRARLAFDRPESWAMKYFTSLSLPTGMGLRPAPCWVRRGQARRRQQDARHWPAAGEDRPARELLAGARLRPSRQRPRCDAKHLQCGGRSPLRTLAELAARPARVRPARHAEGRHHVQRRGGGGGGGPSAEPVPVRGAVERRVEAAARGLRGHDRLWHGVVAPPCRRERQPLGSTVPSGCALFWDHRPYAAANQRQHRLGGRRRG